MEPVAANHAWVSEEKFEKIKYETDSPIAPEICVEVLSDSNTEDEIREKRKLYFEKGAEEVWTCSRDGEIIFFDQKGKLKRSLLVAEFPNKIDI